MIYTVHKAKSQFSRLLKEVEAGRDVLIARGRRGRPGFQVVRITGSAGSRLQPARVLARGIKLPAAAKLATPLPAEEWGDLMT